MPELPEIEAYLMALRPRIVGEPLERVRVSGISLLRTYDPPLSAAEGRLVTDVSRLGKRVVIELDDHFLVIHLMIAGRLRWREHNAAIPKKAGQAAFDFPQGTVLFTEAGTKRRASLHFVVGRDSLADLDPGGLEVGAISEDEFREAVLRERHTLKRVLTDGRVLSGIGGAFADEILWEAQLSPTQINTNLDDDELGSLFVASRDVLDRWTEIRIADVGEGFPEKVTAFHPEMAVHGRYGEPCPRCGAPIQRIVQGKRETNYCPGCQTDGRILADRSLSRLLKDDWPRTLDEL